MSIETTMREILAAESRAVENIPYTADFDRAVNLIVEHVHHCRGKLVTSGESSSPQAWVKPGRLP